MLYNHQFLEDLKVHHTLRENSAVWWCADNLSSNPAFLLVLIINLRLVEIGWGVNDTASLAKLALCNVACCVTWLQFCPVHPGLQEQVACESIPPTHCPLEPQPFLQAVSCIEHPLALPRLNDTVPRSINCEREWWQI